MNDPRLAVTHPPRPLPAPLRPRINRLAHAHALRYETQLRATAMRQIQAARDAGSSLDELVALVDSLARGPLPPVAAP